MGKEQIVNRIIADAEVEAAEILCNAKERADGIVCTANERAAEERTQTEAEANVRTKRILEGKAAQARLDSAKIVLAEKRRVIEQIYERALQKLISMNKSDTLALIEKLLKEHAEEGDEIVLAKNFAYAEGVAALPIIKERKLIISGERVNLSGGCVLRGKLSDKDLSYGALLDADKEEHQADLAAKLFNS